MSERAKVKAEASFTPSIRHTPEKTILLGHKLTLKNALRSTEISVAHPPLAQITQRAPCNTCMSPIQAKLTIGQPNDKYEQEADQVADLVMHMSEPKVHRQKEHGEEALQIKSLTGQIAPLIQRQVEPEEVQDEEILQTKPLAGQVSPSVQRQVELKDKGKTIRSPNSLDDLGYRIKIRSFKSGGQPLPESDRNFFEPLLRRDFSQVRIHNDTEASEEARAVGARAFTVGQNILFGEGQFSLQTISGRKLLAHELVHVIQQRNLSPFQNNKINSSDNHLGHPTCSNDFTIQKKPLDPNEKPSWLSKREIKINSPAEFERFLKESSYKQFIRYYKYEGVFPGEERAKDNSLYFDIGYPRNEGRASPRGNRIFIKVGPHDSWDEMAATIYHEIIHVGHIRTGIEIFESETQTAEGQKLGTPEIKSRKSRKLKEKYGTDVSQYANTEVLAVAKTFSEFFPSKPGVAADHLATLAVILPTRITSNYDMASVDAKNLVMKEILKVTEDPYKMRRFEKIVIPKLKEAVLQLKATKFLKDLCKEPTISCKIPVQTNSKKLRRKGRP